MRLDRFLANSGVGTRSEVKLILKQNKIKVNEETVNNGSFKIDIKCDIIKYNNKQIEYKPYIYLMLNKPQGYISATEDERHKTVLDLIGDEYKTYSLFPIGRLDKDTEGMLILSNDGIMCHNLLSPIKHVDKKYYVELKKDITNDDIIKIENGITLINGYTTKQSKIERITDNTLYITIVEGKYHQIKLMFKAIYNKVVFLKRISMGKLKLDENLKVGDYRELTEKEIDILARR